MTPEEGEMSTCTTACNVAVDARADSAGSHARWLALTCSPEQVHVSGRHAAAAAASAAVPGAALALARGRVDDSVPGAPGPVTLRRYRAAGSPQDSEGAGWHLAGVSPRRAREHRRDCGGLAGLVGWLTVLGRPMPIGLIVTAMLAGFDPEHVLTYLALSDWIGWPSTLEDVLGETTRLQLSPQDVLACLAFGLHETDEGCPTWRHGRGKLVLDVAARCGATPARVAHYLAAGAQPEQIVAAGGRPDVVDLTLLERLPAQLAGDCPALSEPARAHA